MKRNRLEKYESKITPETSPEQLKQAREISVNMIMSVIDRLPANIEPVAESFNELFAQLKKPQRQSSVIVQRFDGKTIEVKNCKIRKVDSFDDTGILLSNSDNETEKTTSIFSQDEIEILERLKNS